MQTEIEVSGTLKELAQVRAELRGQVKSAEEVLPAGATPVEEVAPVTEEVPVAAAPVEEIEEIIKIGDKEFKSSAEAIEYAKSLEYEKLVNEAYNQGVRETIQATASKVEVPPEEDKFDEEFYSNPKEKLKQIKEQAKTEALAAVQAEQRKESLWNQFLGQNPDIERRDAERILAENFETLGKMTDVTKAMQILATKTRSEYQRMAERLAPRKELPNKGGQVVSAGSGAPPSVTPQKKVEQSLDFTSQMRNLRKR